MGFCSSTCNSNDFMANKKFVAEIKELLGNLVDILDRMDMASGVYSPKESAPRDSAPKAIEMDVAKVTQPTIEDKLRDWDKNYTCSNNEMSKLLSHTCKTNNYELLQYIINADQRQNNELDHLLMKLVAPSRAYAKVLILNVHNPLLLALDHPDLSMVKYMCMLTNAYAIKSCTIEYVARTIILLSRHILDAVDNQDLPSLRYFQSWLSDYGSGYGLCRHALIETALTNPNLAIIRYMRDEMGINFHKALDPYIFKVYSSHWVLDRVYTNDTGVCIPCHKDNVWELLCVLHELNYTRFYEFVQDLVAAGRVVLVLRAFKVGYVTRSQMEQLLLGFPSVFVQCLIKC
jgi:hypothetical protein